MSDVVALAEQLGSEQMAVRAAAAEQLCQLGEEAQPAATLLVRACGDDEQVSQWANACLESIGAPPQESFDELVGLITDTSELVAYWAVTLLGRLGPQASASVNDLADIVTTAAHPSVQQRAVWALGQIGRSSESVTSALRQAREASDPRLARLAEEALASVSPTDA